MYIVKTNNALQAIFLMIISFVFSLHAIASDNVNYKVDSDWGSAFQATITVINNSSETYEDWKLEFDFPYTISSIWGAQKVSIVNNKYTIKPPSWKSNLNPGETLSFGFIATPGDAPIRPTNIIINGTSIGPDENTQPTATDDSSSTMVDTTVIINVLSNDSDIDGDTLSISAISTPSKGAAQINGNQIVYTPNNGVTGNDTFSYTIEDGNGGSDTGNVTVSIKDEAITTTSAVKFVVTSDWTAAFNTNIFITNITSEPFTSWELEFDFPHNIGSLWDASIVEHTGDHYKIKSTWNGNLAVGATTSFGFGANPGGTITEPSNIILNGKPVTGDPIKPVASNDTTQTEENTSVNIDVLSNDSGENIILINVTHPNNGSVDIQDQQIVYTPTTDFCGSDSFVYTIEDRNSQHVTATVSISVTEKLLPEEQPPIAGHDTISLTMDTQTTIYLLDNDNAPNGGLSIKSIDQPTNGSVVLSENNAVYTPQGGFIGNDSFTYTIVDAFGLTASGLVTVSVKEKNNFSKIIVGNWHNWDLGAFCPGIKLTDVYKKYNVVHISFATPVDDSMTMQFSVDPGVETEESFQQGVAKLQSEGRKVIISMGGAETRVLLTDEIKKQNFINSMITIIEKYNFDGLDIDLEVRSVVLDAGDNDFRNPTTTTIANLIDAVKSIHKHFKDNGKDIWISLVPEVGHVQQGMEVYFDVYGSYLPVIYGLKDILTYVACQYMNVGSGNRIIALDGQKYQNGTPDFVVAMTEMLLKGFPVTNLLGETIQFPALREDQVGFAAPSTPISAPAGGYMQPSEMYKALDYLTKGKSFGGNYQIVNSNGYPDMRGMVTWSINWDNTTDGGTAVNEFSDSYYDYFNSTEPNVNDAPTGINDSVETEVNSPVIINVLSNDIDSNGDSLIITSVSFPQNGTATYTDSTIEYIPNDGFTGSESFDYTISDGKGGTATASVTVTVNTPVIQTYTVTSSVNSSTGGSISPSGEITVEKGDSHTFTITPEEGYNIKDVKVNGSSIGQVTSYQFTNINANLTIEAEFEQEQQLGNISPTISYIQPTDNQVITQEILSPVTIKINANDTDGNIASILIEVDNQLFDNSSANWTPSSYGYHHISATVTDDSGATAIAFMTVLIKKGSVFELSEKKLIGYVTTWDAWKESSYGLPAQGVYNQLNIDYSKYTTLCYSFFGVAKDGSIHSGDLRNKDMNADQEPGDMILSDIYSSWEMWLLYGDVKYYYSIDSYLEDLGYRTDDWSTWYNINTGETGIFPLLTTINNGAPGLFKLCKESNTKLIATLGGWSMSKHFPEMAADPVKKAKFLKNCKDLMNMGFDGIDIDWEFPGPFSGMNFSGTFADYANFTALIKDIREVIGEDKVLSAGLSSAHDQLAGFEWNELNKYMDYYNIMTYDMNGGWSEVTGHNSPLYSVEGENSWDATYTYLTNSLGVPEDKIVMGVGFYGRGVETDGDAYLGAPTYKTMKTFYTDGYASSASDFKNWPLFEGSPYYAYIKQNMEDWEYNWDDIAQVPYLTKGNAFLSYDNAKSIKAKAEYIKNSNAAGVLVWQVFGDMEFEGGVSYSSIKKLPKADSVRTELLDVLHENLNN